MDEALRMLLTTQPAGESTMAHIISVVVLCSAVAGSWGTPRWQVPPQAPHKDVQTTQGVVRGYQIKQPLHYAFLGIPYAGKISKHDRFKAPLPPPQWDGIFEATHRVRCPQARQKNLDENCLVVNIFTPLEAVDAPVLVHVHDGSFNTGYGAEKVAPRLLRENIILVTFNYRLGPLGYLCLGTVEAPGNAGLKDQIAALYWVHRNIQSFGGDPRQVTAHGTGTGAISIELLLLSKATEHLIQRAILESGTALSENAISYDPIQTARAGESILTSELEPADISISELYKRYKSANISQLIKTTDGNISTQFAPCIEKGMNYKNSLITGDPLATFHENIYHHIPLIVIYTSLEGVHKATETTDETAADVSEALPTNLHFPHEIIKIKVIELINDFYFGFNEILNNPVLELVKYFNDIARYYIVKSAMLHASNQKEPVYLMEFVYDGDLTDINWIKETRHGVIQNHIYDSEDLTEDDELVASRLAAIWCNFIKYGDPTPLTSTHMPVVWEPIAPNTDDITHVRALHLKRSPAMKEPTAVNRLLFWDKIYHNFYKQHTVPDDEDV